MGRDQLDQDDEGNGEHGGVEPPAPRRLREQQVRHPQHQAADDERDPEAGHLVAHPLGDRLVREAVGVLPHEALVVDPRKVDHGRDQREDDPVDRDHEEPLAADTGRPVAHAAGEPGPEEQRRDEQPPDRVGHPQEVAAAMVGQRLRRRLGHRDPVCRGRQWRRALGHRPDRHQQDEGEQQRAARHDAGSSTCSGYARSPASTFTGSRFSGSGIGQVVNGLNAQGGL